MKGGGALATPTAEGACAVIKLREQENVGQNESRNTAPPTTSPFLVVFSITGINLNAGDVIVSGQ